MATNRTQNRTHAYLEHACSSPADCQPLSHSPSVCLLQHQIINDPCGNSFVKAPSVDPQLTVELCCVLCSVCVYIARVLYVCSIVFILYDIVFHACSMCVACVLCAVCCV